jgi:hypothetical protein
VVVGLEDSTDTQELAVEAEVEGCDVREAEKQIADRFEGRRFSNLVLTEDDLKVGLGRRKLESTAVETAVL